jgi:phosphatidylglycerophosphate synthase
MADNKADAVRIQTSVLNALEKKVLVWLAERQPKWMTSDILTYLGTFGAVVIAAGYILASRNINFLWLSSLGFVINWYGDSLDGTLARVRKLQRPVYGYYLDHTIDAINEVMIFVSVGISGLMHLNIALLALVMYLLITLNVSINAHLKKEFRLTYAKMGPTEFRIIMVIVNTLFIMIRPLREFSYTFMICGQEYVFRALDFIGMAIVVVLAVIHLVTISSDIREYAVMDPMPKKSR